jgi:hypothetical protein
VPRRQTYVPKHRGPAAEPVLKRGIRKSVLYSGVAVAATGLAVSSGFVSRDDAAGDDVTAAALSAAEDRRDQDRKGADPALASRGDGVSRSDRRSAVDIAKKQALSQGSGGQSTHVEDLSDADPRTIARALMPRYGFSLDEFGCLDALYVSESGWDPHADNPISSAYGIPQALTGGTHDNLPADYMTNPVSQIEWGLQYIKDAYGSPCAAWDFKQSHNWY